MASLASASRTRSPLGRSSTPSARRRYSENVYFQDGAVMTGVLLAMLYLVLATSLDAAGYVESLTLLIPVTLAAFALGILMAFSRFDGFFALSHSMFTGLAWILFQMSRLVGENEIAPFVTNGVPEMQAKAYFVLLRWLNWIDAALNNIASADNYIFIFEMCFLVWWLTYLGVWSVFRYGYTWRAIVPAGLVLLINTYYAPTSILGFLIVFCLFAMLIFVRTHLSEQQLRWREKRVYFSQDISFDFLRNGFYFSIVVLGLAWLTPTEVGRSWQVRTVMAPLNEQWQTTTERWNRLYQGLNRQTRPAAATFGRTLSLGGARNVGNSYVLRMQTSAGRYWRAVVYDSYTGRQWLNTGEEEMNFDANEAVPNAGWLLREEITQTVTLMAPSGNLVFGAPDILRSTLPMEALVRRIPAMEPAAQTGLVEISLARSGVLLEAGDSYSVVSSYAKVTERALGSAGTDYPPEIVEQYLQLPEDFSQRVQETAAGLVTAAETPYAKAKAIETFLRGYTYNEEIDAPPADVDPVEYFLYDIQEGYCDYYATSMAVMLRSVGVPTRVVSGYAEGTFDEETGAIYVSERDAHTWVEVFFPNYGWIEFEPTAGESVLSRPLGEDPMSLGFDDMLMEEYEEGLFPTQGIGDGMNDPAMMEDLFGSEFDTGALNATEQAQQRWGWIIGTFLLLTAGLVWVWRTRFAGPTQFDPDLPPMFFERLQRWAVRLGLTLQSSYTPYEQARVMSQALPSGRGPIESITETYVRYRFAQRHDGTSQGINQDAETRTGQATSLNAAWLDLRKELWRAWFRKVTGRTRRLNEKHYKLVKQ